MMSRGMLAFAVAAVVVAVVAAATVNPEAPTTAAPAPTANTGCGAKPADIHFLLDASGSVGAPNFQKQLEFVKNFVKNFNIGNNDVKVGLTTFSNGVDNAFFMKDFNNKQALLAAIDNVTYSQGVTHTGEGLKFIRENAFLPANGARANVPNILIVTTDGQSTVPANTKAQADLLHKDPQHINTFAIGIGANVNQTELGLIASDAKHVFNVASFDAFDSIAAELQKTTCAAVVAQPPAPTGCGAKPADIHFLLDASGSVGAPNFQKQLDFVKNFVKNFNIGNNDVKVGLTTFSNGVDNAFFMKDFNNKNDLLAAIDKVNYAQGVTETGQGLKFIRENAFLPANGARANVPNILIVTTDGQSTHAVDTKNEADLLHKDPQNINTFAIGIGANVNKTELGLIASDAKHVFNVASFDAFDSIAAELQKTTCEVFEPEVPDHGCGAKPADIHFLLDASGSVGAPNFQKQLGFVKNFVKNFKLGNNGMRFGVTTFSSSVNHEFWMNTYHNKQGILNAISNVTYTQGTTYTDDGLKFVRENAFLKNHGGRDNAANILIVVTDGQSTRPDGTRVEADLIHKDPQDINVIAVGVGSGVDRKELELIASDNSSVYTVDSFDALTKIQTELAKKSCEAVVNEPVAGCSNKVAKADIHFLLDASGSIGQDNYNKQLQFVKNFANSFNLGPNNVQIGVTTFSTVANNEFFMNQHANKHQVLQAIDNIHYAHGSTHTELGLEFVREEAFTRQHGDRPGVANILVVITDGKSSSPASTIIESNAVHKLNINVLSIGVGDGVDKQELETIASNPSNVYTVSDFDALDNIKHALQNATCTEAENSRCNAPIDLVFLVDKSASINSSQFAVEQNFVEQMIHKFHVGPNEVKVALALFANNVRHRFCFNNYTTQHDVIAAVKNLSCPECLRGQTFTGHALDWATNYILTAKCGSRPDANKVVVVLTDGQSTEHPASYIKTQAKNLQRTGATVITVGVGDAKESELEMIASKDRYVFTADNFNELIPILDDVSASACKAPDASKVCNSKLDLTFLVDKSASIDDQEFIVEEEFMEQLVGKFHVGKNAVHTSLALFANHVHHKWCFNDYTNTNQVIQAVQNLSCPTCLRGKTGTGEALQLAREYILANKSCGARPGVTQVVVVLTDGASTENKTYFEEQTKLMKATGATVMAVGVGVTNQQELEMLASRHDLVFTPSDFTHLLPILEKVADTACEVAPTPPPPPQLCGHQSKSKACHILRQHGTGHQKINLLKYHIDGNPKNDSTTAYGNIRDMCAGHLAKFSRYTCDLCPAGTPSGEVCAKNIVLDYILNLAHNGTLTVNQLVGGCVECNSPHYYGFAVDVAAPGREQEIIDTCRKMGGTPTDRYGQSTMCDFPIPARLLRSTTPTP